MHRLHKNHVQGSSKLGVQGCSRVFKRSSMVLKGLQGFRHGGHWQHWHWQVLKIFKGHEGIFRSHVTVCLWPLIVPHVIDHAPPTPYFLRPPQPTGWLCKWSDHFRGPTGEQRAHLWHPRGGARPDLESARDLNRLLANLSSCR